jgi:hypothetical protein
MAEELKMQVMETGKRMLGEESLKDSNCVITLLDLITTEVKYQLSVFYILRYPFKLFGKEDG